MSVLYPGAECDSAYHIDYKKERESGICGVLFDIDNTLVRHGAPAEEETVALFEQLRALGLKTCLISNNRRERVEPFAKAVQAEFVCMANKPFPANYKKAMAMMGTDSSTTLFVGDQLFTDVWGANLAGMRSILVKPIHPKEEIQIVIKRFFEKIVLYFYHRSLKNKEGAA